MKNTENKKEDFDLTQDLIDIQCQCSFMMEVAYTQFHMESRGERVFSENSRIGYDIISDELLKRFDGIIKRVEELA